MNLIILFLFSFSFASLSEYDEIDGNLVVFNDRTYAKYMFEPMAIIIEFT